MGRCQKSLLTLSVTFVVYSTAIFAADKPGPEAVGRFVVDFGYEEAVTRRWLLRAFEQNVYHHLGNFQRLAPVDKASFGKLPCRSQDLNCVLRFYGSKEIDIFIRGYFVGQSISFEVYNTATGVLASSGNFDIGPDADIRKVPVEVFSTLKPFLENGGILDQKFRKKSGKASFLDIDYKFIFSDWLASNARPLLFACAILFTLAVFLPALLVLISLGKVHRKSLPKRAVIGSILTLLLATLGFLSEFGFYDLPKLSTWFPLFGQLTTGAWVLPLLGGLAWGKFIVLNLAFVCPSLRGLEGARQEAILPLVRAAAVVTSFRLMATILFYGPIFFLFFLVTSALNVEGLTKICVTPIYGLVVGVWLRSFVDGLATRLDAEWVLGYATEDNIWHQRIKRYLEYRNGQLSNPLPMEDLDSILFLPSRTDDTVTYGGGFSKNRIVIGKTLLETTFNLKMDSNVDPRNEVVDENHRDDDHADFLLGAIYQEIGKIHRGEHLVRALRNSSYKKATPTDAENNNFLRRSLNFLKRKYKRSACILLDSFPALAGALDHQIQHLFFLETKKKDFLTRNADPLRLASKSRDVFSRFKSKNPTETPSQGILTVPNRLRWLAPHAVAHREGKKAKSLRPSITWGCVGIVVLCLFLFHLQKAIAYAGVFEQRIQDLKDKIKEESPSMTEGETTHE